MGLESLLAERMFGAYNRGYLSLWILSFRLTERQKSRCLPGKAKANFAGEKGSLQNALQM